MENFKFLYLISIFAFFKLYFMERKFHTERATFTAQFQLYIHFVVLAITANDMRITVSEGTILVQKTTHIVPFKQLISKVNMC